jgi:hypothetical protein
MKRPFEKETTNTIQKIATVAQSSPGPFCRTSVFLLARVSVSPANLEAVYRHHTRRRSPRKKTAAVEAMPVIGRLRFFRLSLGEALRRRFVKPAAPATPSCAELAAKAQRAAETKRAAELAADNEMVSSGTRLRLGCRAARRSLPWPGVRRPCAHAQGAPCRLGQGIARRQSRAVETAAACAPGPREESELIHLGLHLDFSRHHADPSPEPEAPKPKHQPLRDWLRSLKRKPCESAVDAGFEVAE